MINEHLQKALSISSSYIFSSQLDQSYEKGHHSVGLAFAHFSQLRSVIFLAEEIFSAIAKPAPFSNFFKNAFTFSPFAIQICKEKVFFSDKKQASVVDYSVPKKVFFYVEKHLSTTIQVVVLVEAVTLVIFKNYTVGCSVLASFAFTYALKKDLISGVSFYWFNKIHTITYLFSNIVWGTKWDKISTIGFLALNILSTYEERKPFEIPAVLITPPPEQMLNEVLSNNIQEDFKEKIELEFEQFLEVVNGKEYDFSINQEMIVPYEEKLPTARANVNLKLLSTTFERLCENGKNDLQYQKKIQNLLFEDAEWIKYRTFKNYDQVIITGTQTELDFIKEHAFTFIKEGIEKFVIQIETGNFGEKTILDPKVFVNMFTYGAEWILKLDEKNPLEKDQKETELIEMGITGHYCSTGLTSFTRELYSKSCPDVTGANLTLQNRVHKILSFERLILFNQFFQDMLEKVKLYRWIIKNDDEHNNGLARSLVGNYLGFPFAHLYDLDSTISSLDIAKRFFLIITQIKTLFFRRYTYYFIIDAVWNAATVQNTNNLTKRDLSLRLPYRELNQWFKQRCSVELKKDEKGYNEFVNKYLLDDDSRLTRTFIAFFLFKNGFLKLEKK